MGGTTTEWLASLMQSRYYDIDERRRGLTIPILPWIHPPVDRGIQALIRKLGIEHSYDKGQRLFTEDERVSQVGLVISGVTARNFGNHSARCEKAAAVSIPGHIACGNLNFFTQRPAFGRYFTLTPAKVVMVPQNTLFGVLKTERALLDKFVRHMECCTLSDRIGLAAMAFIPVDLRMKSFIVSWVLNYGQPYRKDGEVWVHMPTPLTRSNRSLIANTSTISTDKTLKIWKEGGYWNRTGDWVDFPIRPFEEAWEWIIAAADPSPYDFPKTLEEMLLLFSESHA
jgi:hypothetical protein